MFRHRILILATLMSAPSLSGSLLNAEQFLFAPPKDYKIAYRSTGYGPQLSEWIPATETLENWTHMFTAQITYGASMTPRDYLIYVRKTFTAACPDATDNGIIIGQTNGYAAATLQLQCPKNAATDKPETTMLRVIQGDGILYSVQHAWRSIPSPQEINATRNDLEHVSLCDRHDHLHPCPFIAE